MKKVTALLLSLCLLFCILPPAYSEEEPEDTAPTAHDRGEVFIVEEAVDRRDATSKTFLLSDGSYFAYIYGLAVHMQDEMPVHICRNDHAQMFILNDIGNPYDYALTNAGFLDIAKRVVTHELGHALGFFSHSPDYHETMFYTINESLYYSNYFTYYLQTNEINHLLQIKTIYSD